VIRERFAVFIRRITDEVFLGRNRSRIVLGTDRKNTANSGHGDEGRNEVDSASIDLVAGHDPESGDMSFENDKTRVYLSAMADPDDYLSINKGATVEGEPSLLMTSGNVYIKARNKTKIVGPKYSIILEDDTIVIETEREIEIKTGQSKIKLGPDGISLDASQGDKGRIITERDICVGIDPVSGSPILSSFQNVAMGALINNQKVNIK
jgi:hypothetical protein